MAEEEINTAIDSAYDEQGTYDPVVPEKTLLAAILMNAVYDLQHDGANAVKAANYLLDPSDNYVFSFRSVCNFLNIDPKRVLKFAGLIKGKEIKGEEKNSIE